jgi:hypothetical protein
MGLIFITVGSMQWFCFIFARYVTMIRMKQKDKNAAAWRDFFYERTSGDWSMHQASEISRHFLSPK